MARLTGVPQSEFRDVGTILIQIERREREASESG